MDADVTPTDQTFLSGPQAVSRGAVVSGRYRIDKCLASGGYGDVWRGVDLETEAEIALKILRTDAGNNDPSAIARMRQEAEILKAMDHPNIVRVFGFGNSPFGHYLAMEFLDGLAIDQWLAKFGPIDAEEMIAIADQLLGALDEAHRKQILHRDLKPENIILVPDADDPDRRVAKLVDFGIAKAHRLLNENDDGATLVQTRAGGFMGTPRYAAPEQAVGDPCGPNTDLFALGLVIAEWLTGRMRLDGERHADVMTQLLGTEEIDVSDVPYRWREWLGRMVQKNPQERYQSASEARKGLVELVEKLHQRADFLDDNQHVLPFAEPRADEGSFLEDQAPLELDFDRVRTHQPTPAALRPFASSPLLGDIPANSVQSPPSRHATPPLGTQKHDPSTLTKVVFFVGVGIVIMAFAFLVVAILSGIE